MFLIFYFKLEKKILLVATRKKGTFLHPSAWKLDFVSEGKDEKCLVRGYGCNFLHPRSPAESRDCRVLPVSVQLAISDEGNFLMVGYSGVVRGTCTAWQSGGRTPCVTACLTESSPVM